MDKMKILNYLKKAEVNKEQEDLICAIEEARLELERARNYFNQVSEPKLIDFAIYSEQAAGARYGYLIELAKKMGVISELGSCIYRSDAI